jgi:hypothetical protein
LETVPVLELTFEGENIGNSNVSNEVPQWFIIDKFRTIKIV